MDKLQADKLTEIKAEYARVEEMYIKNPEMRDKYDQAHEWIGYLLQLVETQAQALEWYADEENYEQQWKDHGYWADPEIDDDRGQRAREALTQI